MDSKQEAKIKKEEKKEKLLSIQKKEEKKVVEAKESAEKAIKKVVAKQETAPGGIIDIVTQALAKNAQLQKSRQDDRSRIQAIIDARVTATQSALNTTRAALKSGIHTVDDITMEGSKAQA